MNIINCKNFNIYNSVFEYINSNMYTIIENQEALIIDPHIDNEILELLNKNNVEKVTILLTHEHPDHISGTYWYQEKFDNVLISTKYCSEYISQEKNVRPILINFVLEERDKRNGTNLLEKFNNEFIPHTYTADITFEENFQYNWQNYNLEFFKMLGHSKGSCGIILNEEYVFTGDTLMKTYPVITRFPGGNTKTYKNETLPFLEAKLNPEMTIFPGHGNPFTLGKIMKDGKIQIRYR